MASSHPLRPYYTPTDEDVAFVATAPRFRAGATGSTAPSAGTTAAGGAGSYAVPGFVASNRYTSQMDDAALGEAMEGLPAGGVKDWAKALALSAAFGYTSTCLAMPFEVGKLLLQVQWVPRDEVWQAFGEMERDQEAARMARRDAARAARAARRGSDDLLAGSPTIRASGSTPIGRNEWNEGDASDEEEDLEQGDDLYASQTASGRDFGAEEDELSDEEDAEAYFRDLSDQSARPTNLTDRTSRQRHKKTDSSGYVMRKSIHEDTTRPEFVMPVVVRRGVWEMIKAVGRGKEGWLGLWKGSLTTFLIDTATQTVQPIVSFVLSFAAPSALTPLPLPYAPYPYRSLSLLMASHLITGIIVSPLDLVRTRLIAQSTLPAHRKYTSPFNALRQILHEEGGWRTTYFHPNLFIPTLLDFTIRPLLSLGSPLFIEHRLRLDPMVNPVRYSLAEFCISTVSLLITLPIETVRRRLQLQARRPLGKTAAPKTGTSTGATRKGAKTSDTSAQSTSYLASITGSAASGQALLGRPLRTCVETRPRPYEGVSEAIYRILTEETGSTPVKKSTTGSKPRTSASSAKTGGARSTSTKKDAMAESSILAKPGSSSFGGLYSLYRGLGFSMGANALVFVLTIVTGERTHATAGWTEI